MDKYSSDLLISIVIPVFNGARLIRQTISCCLNQTHRNIEIIVINDGSTDKTEDIVKGIYSDKRIRYIYQQNAGLAATRNLGIQNAKGSYILFLDHDDLIAEDHLINFAKQIGTNFQISMGFSGYATFDDKNTINIGLTLFGSSSKLGQNIFNRNLAYPIHSILFNAAMVKKINGFNLSFKQCEDRDIILRMLQESSDIFFTNKITCFYRLTAGSMSKRHFENASYMNSLIEKGASSGLLKKKTIFRMKARAIFPFFRNELTNGSIKHKISQIKESYHLLKWGWLDLFVFLIFISVDRFKLKLLCKRNQKINLSSLSNIKQLLNPRQ
jgi:glycosyltransferase involved in cell wall biosynthesis